jgi:aryl-alcohol dehydrogenase-like predicted oxidoreductase
MEETLETFHRLVKKGKVRVLGASNFDTWRLAEANLTAGAKGWTPYTVMQQKFSYLHPKFGTVPKYTFNEHVNRERLRFLCDKDMPLVAYSCLCKGAYENDLRLPADYEGGERLALVRRMAEERGVNPSAIVIAWLTQLHRCEGFPRVIPVFSSSSRHFADNMRGIEIILSDEELQMMNKA